MILIFGGAYQGKKQYALEEIKARPEQVVEHVEEAIREMIRRGENPLEATARLADAAWADKVLLLEDVSCGVVPMDAEDRAWREAVGRCGAYLARRAQRVVRVFCGIGTVIKDA